MGLIAIMHRSPPNNIMPYFECRVGSGNLIDTGSNKNYIQPNLVYIADTPGGDLKIA